MAGFLDNDLGGPGRERREIFLQEIGIEVVRKKLEKTDGFVVDTVFEDYCWIGL